MRSASTSRSPRGVPADSFKSMVGSCSILARADRVAELERHRAQLADLSEEEWDHVDAATRAALAKMLHEPTVLLKETAGTPRGERLVEALRILFDL